MSENAIMQFYGYTVEKVIYLKNDSYDCQKDSLIFPKMAINIVQSETDNSKFNIILGTIYDTESNFPYLLEIVIRGFFETSDDLSNSDKLKTILSNGSAIIYPYMRALFTEMTAKSDFTPIILPTINFYEYIKNLYDNQEDFLIDSSAYKDYE